MKGGRNITSFSSKYLLTRTGLRVDKPFYGTKCCTVSEALCCEKESCCHSLEWEKRGLKGEWLELTFASLVGLLLGGGNLSSLASKAFDLDELEGQ